MLTSLFFVVLLGLALAGNVTTSGNPWPFGEAIHCRERFKTSDFNVDRFEVLPGIGWDNLRNEEAGQIMVFNYSKCRTTDDGVYLIPDGVFTIPIKSSEAHTFAELIDHWMNDSSLTSKTINAHSGLHLPRLKIDGKFSREHTLLKSKQMEDKSVTVRVQMRYNRYEAKLQPDAEFTPEFKSRILTLAAHLALNHTRHAFYEGQLIVKDFGTHVLTSVTAGAALIKDDYLKTDFVEDQTSDKTKILASATVSYNSIFSAGVSTSTYTDKTTDDRYNHSLTRSYVRSEGGGLFVPGVTTAFDWSKTVDSNLVPTDRAGDPLHFLITPHALPEVPPLLVTEVQKIIHKSVEMYYSMNLIPGCTKLSSPNFSFAANFDDGSCHDAPTNKTFGGIYQTCSVSGADLKESPCKGLDQANPLTGKNSCPDNYTPVLLLTGGTSYRYEHVRKCHRCFLFRHCCKTDQLAAKGVYKTYWCAATGHVPQNSGYLFGGIFTKTQANVVTGTRNCPPHFYARRMFVDTFVCISDDFELAAPMSLPFGGFFSCSSGNPLASEGEDTETSSVHNKPGQLLTLKSFVAEETGERLDWPARCPKGYSQHTATYEIGCSVHYCIQSGALAPMGLPPIKRPPFDDKPHVIVDNPDNTFMFDMQTQVWKRNQDVLEINRSDDADNSSSDMSPGLAAGIGVMVTAVFFVGLAGILFLIRRLRHRHAASSA